MFWVYSHYKYCNPFSADTVFIHQNLTSTDVRLLLTYKDGPSAETVKPRFFIKIVRDATLYSLGGGGAWLCLKIWTESDIYIVASELKDPICHSNECQIGSFSSEATIWTGSDVYRRHILTNKDGSRVESIKKFLMVVNP